MSIIRAKHCSFDSEAFYDFDGLFRPGRSNVEYLGPFLQVLESSEVVKLQKYDIHGSKVNGSPITAALSFHEISIDGAKARKYGLMNYVPGTITHENVQAGIVCFKLSTTGFLSGETEIKLLSVENGVFLFRSFSRKESCDVYMVKVVL
jgi:hypothetical protein